MLRHEQQTVRMALAAALHHSAGPEEKVEMQQNGALRGQKTPPPGARPGILAEPGPQRSDRSRRHFSGDTHPTLRLPVLAGESGEVVDDSTIAFLTRAVLEEKRKAEVEQAAKEKVKEERMRRQRRQALVNEIDTLFAVPAWRRSDAEFSRIESLASELRSLDSASSSSGSKRKRKKRRKRKLPKSSSSRSTRGRTHRRVRQWHAPGWFPGFDASLAGFPLVVFRPEMPGIVAGMDQKDNGALIVDSGSGMCKVRFPGFSPCSVFPVVVGRPAGRSAWTRSTILQLAGFYWLRCTSRCVSFPVVMPLMFVGRPAGRSASWLVWTRRRVTSCRAENCGKSAVAVHQQGR